VGSPTIAGAPAGFNGRLSVALYGSRVVRVTSISYPLEVVSSEDVGPVGRVMYPVACEVPGFTLGLIFVSRQEREGFSEWLRGYMERVVADQRVGGYVYVYVPARGFARNGVPIGPLAYGDEVGLASYPVTVSFVAAIEPISGVGKTRVDEVSYYQGPSKDAASVTHFYPAGIQRAGLDEVERVLYDNTEPVLSMVGEPGPLTGPARPDF
jgi:hypothetical protein